MRHILIILLFNSCLLQATAAISATHHPLDTLVFSGDTIWVESYIIPMKLHETGRDIQVLSNETISALPASSPDELMRYIPGLEIQARGPAGVQSDLSLRGSTFSQVLVMVDGVRWNDPLTGHFSASLPVSVGEIDRIEVIKGPASAHYGADAMGGVINIITKTATGSYEGVYSFTGNLSAGSKGYWGGRGNFHFKPGENTTISGGLEHQSADGHKALDGSPYWFDISSTTLALRHQTDGDWRIFYRFAADRRNFSARYFYTANPLDEAEEYTRALYNHLQLTRTGARGRTTIDISHKRNRDRFIFNPDFPPANEHLTTLSLFQLNQWLPLGRGRDLHYGTRMQLRTIESNDRGDHSDHAFSLFAGLRQKLGQRSDIHLALSADRDQNFGFELSPQLSIAHNFERIELRLSGGRSIRAADYTERFISTNLPGPLASGRNLGNPQLQAERAWQIEGGFAMDLFPWMEFHGALFHRQGKNIIDYVRTPAEEIPGQDNLEEGAWYFFSRNIGEVKNTGFELRAEIRGPAILGLNSFLEVGYSRNNIRASEDIEAKYITGQAGHLVNTNLLLRNRDWTFSLNSWYKNRPEDRSPDIDAFLNSSYFAVNSRLGRKVLDGRIHFYLQINNLLDRSYSDITGVKMPGRWLMAGAGWNIGS